MNLLGVFNDRSSTNPHDDVKKNISPWDLYDSKTLLHYIVNRIKKFVTEVATDNTAPFLHRYLYTGRLVEQPPCLVSCFTTSVLYTHRTEANTSMVMRVVHTKASELIATEAGRLFPTPAQKLARTQALFLYQIIRLFDGDVTLRSQSEKDIPLLKTWLAELCRVRDNLDAAAQIDDRAANTRLPIDWERWIFAECMRRTVIMAYAVIMLYDCMRNAEPDVSPWAFIHRWTLSQQLWSADSRLEFERAWRERPHCVISNFSFNKFLEFGKGEDVDAFAEIMLSM